MRSHAFSVESLIQPRALVIVPAPFVRSQDTNSAATRPVAGRSRWSGGGADAGAAADFWSRKSASCGPCITRSDVSAGEDGHG